MGDGGREEKKVTNKQATRRQLQLRRARTSTNGDAISIAEYERTTLVAAIVMGIAFGIMFALGVM